MTFPKLRTDFSTYWSVLKIIIINSTLTFLNFPFYLKMKIQFTYYNIYLFIVQNKFCVFFFWVYSQVMPPLLQSTLEHFYFHQRKSCNHQRYSTSTCIPSSSWKKNLLFYLWAYLFWTYHMNGVMRFAIFSDWFL
jgi:hypothetical protein